MKQPRPEDLLGYVLGALDATETQEIESSIQENPEIEKDLEQYQSMMAPLEYMESDNAPPAGLARRSIEFVAGRDREKRMTPVFDDPASSNRWTFSDILVGTVTVVILTAIMIPAFQYARFSSRQMECQSNLRQVGFALLDYSDMNPGRTFIPVPNCPENRLNVAGSYAPQLIEHGLVQEPVRFFCPGRGDVDSEFREIPTIDRIKTASNEEVVRLQRTMGGDFGYCMGYTDPQGRYRPVSGRGRRFFAVLADHPSVSLPGRKSLNHGGAGQNVWFEDGHIEFLSDPVTPCGDSIFENNQGNLGPGCCPDDICVSPSQASPFGR